MKTLPGQETTFHCFPPSLSPCKSRGRKRPGHRASGLMAEDLTERGQHLKNSSSQRARAWVPHKALTVCGHCPPDKRGRAWESGAGVQATGQAAGECPRPLPHQAPGRRGRGVARQGCPEWEDKPRIQHQFPGCRGWLV